MKPQAAPTIVEVRREVVVLPTYEPLRPDRNPMFLERRVYQGSSGRVYPLPFTDSIADKPRACAWEAVFIENEFVRVMILPALGGRIHRLQDKTNGFDLIYHQPVIKPALVGLAGPWASGGIEFNWPQHHRPSTFMPADVAVEKHAGGAVTVWLSEHDPMARMKGMHGVRLHPGRSFIELVMRAYNRTPDVQTFLWWANVATRAHELYQSFFPPDATFVADHARRAISTFPLCDSGYYGVDYAARGRGGIPRQEMPRQFSPRHRGGDPIAANGAAPAYAPNDLSWYANIPVPTSYMCLGSKGNFVGGYDHRAQAGIVHVADHHISPGKKQWTWGNHEFGYAWDRNLTDPDARGEYPPYVELMAGTYTDNQPDFSFLQPGETKTWSQFWYPIRKIGPVHRANTEAAVSLSLERGIARIGICVTGRHPDARVRLMERGTLAGEWMQAISPDRPLVFEVIVDRGSRPDAFELIVIDGRGAELIRHAPATASSSAAPAPAIEPPAPGDVRTSDELFVIGLHLEQYRHATRMPEPYWREALRRDPGDARSNLALGRWHLRRGEFGDAERLLRASITRLLARNPNPYDGEPHYQLGICLRRRALAAGVDHVLLDDAYAALFKATWNHAWQPAGFHALAEIDALRGEWNRALEHADRALRLNADNLRARDLKAIILRRLGRPDDAAGLLRETLALDPLDWWARHLIGDPLTCDTQVRLDLALDYAVAGQFRDAIDVLSEAPSGTRRSPTPAGNDPFADLPDASLGTLPLVHYYRAWLCHQIGDRRAERRHLASAARAGSDYCFPARLEEIDILRHAIEANPRDANAPYLLGNLLYDRRRHDEGIRMWERAVRLNPRNAVAWRNLGIGYFNVQAKTNAARAAFERALAADPSDARLLYERDQLWKRLGIAPSRRLGQLRKHMRLVASRDDLSVELCSLYNQTGAPQKALPILATRRFQPWEGGEGMALRQHTRAHLALGRRALSRGNARESSGHFREALTARKNLGEAHHLLANQSDTHYWLGCALEKAGDLDGSRAAWETAAGFTGGFQGMRVKEISEMSYFSALALMRLGRKAEAKRLLHTILGHARRLARSPARIDYFATSLPTMLLFDDDLKERQGTTAMFLAAQARLGLGQRAAGRRLLKGVLKRDPSHAPAADQPT